MTELELYQAIKAQFGDSVVAIQEPKEPDPPAPPKGKEATWKVQRPKPLPPGAKAIGWIEIKPSAVREVAAWIRTAPGIELDFPHCLSGVDYAADKPLGVTYHFTSIRHKHWVAIKVSVPRENPVVASITDIFPGMNWHEREAFDLLGIVFEGHPNLRRILCAEDWEGYPLRKDYEFPKSYHGLPTDKEVRWNS